MLIHKTLLLLPIILTPIPVSATPSRPSKPPDNQQHVLASPSPISPQRSRVEGFISLGDSYSAGIGTRPSPSLPDESRCRQGRGAYPYLLASDFLSPSPSPSANSSFQWLSCTGSTTHDLLSSSPPSSSQIDRINTTYPPTFATLTIGGNDLDFFSVLNACVFRFYGPWYGSSCSAALSSAEEMFSPNSTQHLQLKLRIRLILTEILNKIRWDHHPKFLITVTGYAQFFNADTTLCDDTSLGIWLGGAEKLTRHVRKHLNSLVKKANQLLEEVAEEVDAGFLATSPSPDKRRKKIVFINYDAAFTGHRFCEPKVKEPAYSRKETWFFLPGGVDVDQAGNTYPYEEKTNIIDKTNPLVNPETCLEAAGRTGGDWGEKALCHMARAKQHDPKLEMREKKKKPGDDSMWFTPTYYGKTFHPRSAGHEAIRDRIYQVWEEHGLLD
ncbi:SGNH hydrolase-type esterase domain-containing protein [Podospora australis]|uniref:SGNH hydrolase-type esterase domain-containing protein n=1 Tax=Podospora australis TaxID=1536484 RepID=A0AAN6WZY9_9PEZI|nr:SGNH hydrolase-type esterase domain-containing protein [Podospora australis]